MGITRRTFTITEYQNYELEGWKWKYHLTCSEIVRRILDDHIKNPDKLKKILISGNKNDKKPF